MAYTLHKFAFSYGLAAAILLVGAVIFAGGCLGGGSGSGSGGGEGAACASPHECGFGYTCLDGKCTASGAADAGSDASADVGKDVLGDAQSDGGSDCDCPAWGERCVDGVCEPVEVLTIKFKYDTEASAAPTPSNLTTICARKPVRGEAIGYDTIHRGDDCIVQDEAHPIHRTHETFALDLGTVTMSVEGGSPVEITEHDGGFEFLQGCYDRAGSPDDYSPGASVNLHISGGADFPELDVQATIPQALAPAPEDPVPGEPWEFQWEPGSSGDTVVSIYARFDHDNDPSTFRSIACSTEDDGAFTIPASLTSMLAEGQYLEYFTVDRYSTRDVEPEGAPMAVTVEAEYSYQIEGP